MFKTSIGVFDGGSWEALCQQVFKRRYAAEGYQPMPASPGDFGLEGFTLETGYGFQCYCPDKHYPSKELYEAQRDKITADVGKLKRYQTEIATRIGATRLGHWVFVTPEVDRNLLLAHARSKEEEVRSWSLPILTADFRVLLHDADFYRKEINEVRATSGTALSFETEIAVLAPLTAAKEAYEANIRRKSACRLAPKAAATNYESLLARRSSQSLRAFLECDVFLRRIEEGAPMLYYKIVRLINEYENQVVDTSIGWAGTAEELTAHIRDGLTARLSRSLSPEVDETTAAQISRHMISRWLAICQLDYE